jgi:hypothetical protein
MTFTPKMLRKLSVAALASLTLGGCYYGDVYGSSSYATYDCAGRYGDEYWSNDPYAYDDGYYGYDCYDAADYHAGFAQIGFGGGWHQNLYYPGYGLFLFDRYGRRHSMSHDYLTYWGGRRAWHKHHGGKRDHDRGDGYQGVRRPGRGYQNIGDSDNAPTPRHGGWTSGDGSESPRGRRPRGAVSGGEGHEGRPRRSGNNWTPPVADGGTPVAATPRVPRTNIPARSSGNTGAAPAPRAAAAPRSTPTPRAAPAPSYTPPPARPAQPPRDGGRVRED